MRCFIACFLTNDSAAAVDAGRVPVDGCRAIPRGNLHVTLRFLGSIAPERSEEVVSLVTSLNGCETRATVLEVSGYPRRRRARAIVARLEADPLLEAWQEALASRWLPAGTDEAAFDPHVTLARSRNGVPVPEMPGLRGLPVTLLPPAAYVSDTTSEGARYTRLA